MRKLAVVFLGLLLIAGMVPTLALAHVMVKETADNGGASLAPGEFRPAAALDTVFFGFVTGGTMSKTGVGGVWDWDRDSTGAAIGDPGPGSTVGSGTSIQWVPSAKGIIALQGWTPALNAVQPQAFDPDQALCEPDTYLNYGNVGQFWHQQNMAAVVQRDGVTPNSNIAGAGSLWCGVNQPQASNLFLEFAGDEGITCAVNFPGYANLWDQLVWKDLAISSGGTTMTFTYATDMDNRPEPGDGAAGTPCLGTPPMQNGSYYDQMDVYAGNPVTVPAPTAISDLGELITGSVLLNTAGNASGYRGLQAATTVTTATFGGGVGGIGSAGRVVFRIRTNRDNSDQTGSVSYDGGATTNNGSNYGAAMIDDVYFSNASGKTGGVLDPPGSDGSSIGARYTFDAGMQGWTASAKSLPTYAHIINVGNDDPNVNGIGYNNSDPENKYADPCGWPGHFTVTCNLKNNVYATFSPIIEAGHKDHYSTVYWPVCCPRGETAQGAISPDIDVSTGDGVTPRGRNGAVLQMDSYAFNPLADAVLWQEFIRYKTNPAQACPNWSAWQWHNTQYYTPNPRCNLLDNDESSIVPGATVTHVQMMLCPDTFCWELGSAGASGTCKSNFSPLFDNVQFGLVNSPIAPALTVDPWEFLQDAFTQDKNNAGNAPGVGPNPPYWPMQKRFGSGAARENASLYLKTKSVSDPTIDVQTAVICENLNKNSGPLVNFDDGYFQGDTMGTRAAFSSKGTRIDMVFRVIPGPKCDTTDGWFNAWKANTGCFGTGGNNTPENLGAEVGGKHGGGTPADHWRWYVWNSARMDTTERDTYDAAANTPSVKRATGGVNWSTMYHELDPHFATLGINHELPLVNSASPFAWINEHSGRFTREHTPIIPSYLFTPGTVIDYFFRCCYNSTLALAQSPRTVPDTTALQPQGGNSYHIRILPNAWNDNTTYPGGNIWTGQVGKGRACVLFVDHSQLGAAMAHFPWVRTMDSLGIIADEFFVQAASSGTGSIGGSAMDLVPGHNWRNYGSSYPSLNQMNGYNVVFLESANLNSTPISDATQNDPSADTQLLTAWLNGATATGTGSRGLWWTGTSAAQYIDVYLPDGGQGDQFRDFLGIQANTTDDNSTLKNYRNITSDNTECPTIVADGTPWSLSSSQKISVIFNFCLLNYDMSKPNVAKSAHGSQLWPQASPATGIQNTGVVRDFTAGAGGRAVSFVDALDFTRVRNVSCHDSYGRIYQMRTVYYNLFANGATPFCQHNYASTAVNPGGGRDIATALFQNTPNPFRPNRATAIRYAVGRTSPVTLQIHDVSGRLVRTLVNSKREPGDYLATFDGRDDAGRELAAGVYFYRLKVGDFESNKKMLMLK